VSFEPARQYVRHPLATAITTAGRTLFTRPGESPHHCTTVEPGAASELWEALATPICGRDLLARTEIAPRNVAQLIDSLVENTIVLPWTMGEPQSAESPLPNKPAPRPCGDLILGITGAVQAVFAPHFVQRLSYYFAERLDVVLTESAQKFVQPRALSVLGAHVWSDPFDTGESGRVPHIELATRAELVLVFPATADAIFRLAHGACSDLLSLIVSATRAPVVVAPSMNPVMWRHPATRRNVQLLRDDGVFVVEPGSGSSVSDAVLQPVGAVGFGPDGANLIGTLDLVWRLSRCQEAGTGYRSSSPSPCPRSV
jgi:phosphopantothenoylcysteine decarboxylase / phosphopantothenate---cysteine ligase